MSDEKKSSANILLVPFIMLCGLYIYATSTYRGSSSSSSYVPYKPPPEDADGITHLREAAAARKMKWQVMENMGSSGTYYCASAWIDGLYKLKDDYEVECADNANYAAGRLAKKLNHPSRIVAGPNAAAKK